GSLRSSADFPLVDRLVAPLSSSARNVRPLPAERDRLIVSDRRPERLSGYGHPNFVLAVGSTHIGLSRYPASHRPTDVAASSLKLFPDRVLLLRGVTQSSPANRVPQNRILRAQQRRFVKIGRA